MSSKIEVPRALAETLVYLHETDQYLDIDMAKLRALLAAPAVDHCEDALHMVGRVVERQPGFWKWLDSAYRDGSEGEQPKFTKYNMEVAYQAGVAASVTSILLDVIPGDGHEVFAKSVADVEAVLATQGDEIEELQATIAWLTAENERNAKNSEEWENASLHWMTARDQFKAEIERLKGGQGERNQCDGCNAGIPVVNGNHSMGLEGGYQDLMGCTAKLYKSQPAPVSVALDEREEFERNYLAEALERDGDEYVRMAVQMAWEGWQARACLDKVKELNQ